MNRGQRKNINRVNAPALARWIVITGFVALAGLCYVYLTLQLHHLGDRKKALENELVSLRQQNDVANVQIAALTSRSALQRRLKEGYLKMIPIAEQNIVRLAPLRSAPDEDAIRQVANDRLGK
jgi:hypothetical protein